MSTGDEFIVSCSNVMACGTCVANRLTTTLGALKPGWLHVRIVFLEIVRTRPTTSRAGSKAFIAALHEREIDELNSVYDTPPRLLPFLINADHTKDQLAKLVAALNPFLDNRGCEQRWWGGVGVLRHQPLATGRLIRDCRAEVIEDLAKRCWRWVEPMAPNIFRADP